MSALPPISGPALKLADNPAAMITAAKDGRWKLHRVEPFGGEATHRLYDLVDDPGELRDVADDHADIVDRLATMIGASRRMTPPPPHRPDSMAPPGPRPTWLRPTAAPDGERCLRLRRPRRPVQLAMVGRGGARLRDRIPLRRRRRMARRHHPGTRAHARLRPHRTTLLGHLDRPQRTLPGQGWLSRPDPELERVVGAPGRVNPSCTSCSLASATARPSLCEASRRALERALMLPLRQFKKTCRTVRTRRAARCWRRRLPASSR